MRTPIAPVVRHLASFAGTVLAVVALVTSGCGKSGGNKLTTADLETAFASADASLKGPVGEAVKMLKSGRLFEGTTALAELAKEPDKFSEPQKTALLNIATGVQTVMAEDGDRADLKVYQAVEDLVARLDGRESSKVGVNPDAVRPPKVTEE